MSRRADGLARGELETATAVPAGREQSMGVGKPRERARETGAREGGDERGGGNGPGGDSEENRATEGGREGKGRSSLPPSVFPTAARRATLARWKYRVRGSGTAV